MKRILFDTSSVIGQFMHIKDEEYGTDVEYKGKKFHIPDIETCKEKVESYLMHGLNVLHCEASQLIMVRDPEGTGAARKRKHPEYKASRAERPKQFYNVLNPLIDWTCELVMTSGGVTCTPTMNPAVEADDLINELATRLPETTIWSVDKDMLACPASDYYIGGELNPTKFPVPRKYIRLYRSLIGDPSDNIPGCKGFGEKAWLTMVDTIGVDGVAELEEMVVDKVIHTLSPAAFPKVKLLIDNAEAIYASYDLIGFIPIPMHKVRWEGRIQECDKKLITADNFDVFFPAIQRKIRTAPHCVIDYETDVPPESKVWLEGTKNDDGKSGVGVDVIASEITGMGLKVGFDTYYFSVDHAHTDNITVDQLGKVIDEIGDKSVFAHNSTGFENVVTYNTYGKFLNGMIDTKFMASYVNENEFIGLKSCAKRYLNYAQETYAEVIAKAQERDPSVTGMRGVTAEEVTEYGIDDVIVCDALQNLFTVIMEYEGSYEAFKQVDKDSAFVTSAAFIKGVDFDADAHAQLKEENDKNIVRAKAELSELLLEVGFGDTQWLPMLTVTPAAVRTAYYKCTGDYIDSSARSLSKLVPDLPDTPMGNELRVAIETGGADDINVVYRKFWKPSVELNVRSPKQVSTLLYSTLQAPVRVRNKATDTMRAKGQYEGSPSTDDDAIANAIAFNDVDELGVRTLEKLLEYKGYLTRGSLFLSKYPRYVHWKTGKIHCSMTQCGTTTRRFSHKAPNLAQLPKRKGKEVRNMMKAPEGYYMVSFDFSGQELKLAAWASQCPAFLSCYTGPGEQRKDVHSLTGTELDLRSETPLYGGYETFVEAIAAEAPAAKLLRADGKTVNFATQFLCQAPKLAVELRCGVDEAQKFIDAKADAFPGLMPGVDKWIEKCKARGFSATRLGAVRHLARAFAGKANWEQASAGRLAWSFNIQGSAAEQVKVAMSKMWQQGVISDDCYVAIQVHDELVFMIKKEVFHEYVKTIIEIMTEQYADMEIEADTDPKYGSHFGTLKKYEVSNINIKSL